MKRSTARRIVVGLILLVTAAQVGFAIYRAALVGESSLLGIALSALLLLPLVAEYAYATALVRFAVRPVGIVVLLLGMFAIGLLLNSGVLSLFQRVGTPLFLLSYGALMVINPKVAWGRIAAATLLVIAAALLQTTATWEAHHHRQLAEEGIMAHWH